MPKLYYFQSISNLGHIMLMEENLKNKIYSKELLLKFKLISHSNDTYPIILKASIFVLI